ncbi:MAG TPA: DUF2993 domain-containing protein [Cyanobacteria bacterium UBA11162]|nr:DUF2993 domain-containing protein [Cyanobacteria bacterium UBA11162]
MELFTILLSGLLTILSPPGLIIDSVAENAIRSRFEKVEQLQVRVDNTPNYQLLNGNIEQVRIAGRGLWLTPTIRIDALELETDPINVDLQRLRQRTQDSPAASLQEPLQAGVRLVLTEADINQALNSPNVADQLQQIASRFSRNAAQRYQFINPQVDLLENNRVRFQVEAVEGNAPPLTIVIESGLSIKSGHSLQLIEPVLSVDGKALPSPLVQGFASGISNRFNLRSLEDAGITARLLKLEIDTETLEIATFVRFEPRK